MLGLIVGCLFSAGLVTLLLRPRRGGIPKRFANEQILVKCRDPNCGSVYKANKYEYYEYIEKNTELWALEAPGLVCKDCGKKTVYEAIKCENCGLVFEAYSVPRDFRDRCPRCGHSRIEEARKRAGSSKVKPGTEESESIKGK